MRHLVPTMLLAAMLAAGPSPALAKHRHHRPHRLASHISLHVSRHTVVGGSRVVLTGRVRPRGSRRVKVLVRGPRGATRSVSSNRNGAFAVRWRPSRLGTYRVRAYRAHDRHTRASSSVVRRVTAFHTAAASYYGPGLYGGALACGGTLQPGTLGVAHRTLPCGARVKLSYRGRTVTVPVVDRGPYVAGRDYDLTAATKARLRFPSTGTLLASR